jgi:hypothetical protein
MSAFQLFKQEPSILIANIGLFTIPPSPLSGDIQNNLKILQRKKEPSNESSFEIFLSLDIYRWLIIIERKNLLLIFIKYLSQNWIPHNFISLF